MKTNSLALLRFFPCLFGMAAWLAVPVPRAEASSVWNNAGTSFTASSDWTGGLSSGGSASFGATAPVYQPYLDASFSLSGLSVAAGANGYVLTGASGASLTITGTGSGSGSAIYVATGGNLVLDVPVVFSPSTGSAYVTATGLSSSLVFNGVISGSTALNIGGRVALNSAANTYTGDTYIVGGQNLITVASFGTGGAASSLGAGTSIHVGTAAGVTAATAGSILARINYVGSGETSNKNIDFNAKGITPFVEIDTTGATGGLILTGNISSSVDSSAALTKTLVLEGNTTGNAVTGVISDSTTGTGLTKIAVTKAGSGTWSLSGANTYTGLTTVAGGTLVLDYSAAGAPTTASGIVSSSSMLNVAGGTLAVKGAAGAATSQSFSSTYISPGASSIAVVQNGASSVTLNLGTITRNTGSTVDFTLPTAGSITTTSANGGTSILGGWATVNGTDWATVSGGNIVAYSTVGSYVNDTWASGNNTTVTTSGSVVGNLTTNSLRFDSNSSSTLTLTGVSTVASGGILVTSDVSGQTQTITGGTLRTSGSVDLDVTVNDATGRLVLGSTLDNYSGTLVKSGAGTLVVTGANTGYSQKIYLNAGTLQIGSASALGTTGALYFFGGTLSSAGTTAYTLTNSTINFGGGQVANIGGISNPNLYGNPVAVTLGDLVNNGALTFTGANVKLWGDTTLNVLSDVTFSGVVSDGYNYLGYDSLTKTGSGTLTLNGVNTFTGVTTITGGTLQVGSTGSLSANTSAAAVLVNGSGAVFRYGGSSALAQTVTFGSAGGSFLYNSATAYTGGAIVATANAIVGGTGTVGAVGIYSGGTLSPGDGGVGTFTTGAQTWEGGGTYLWQITNATGTQGVDWDLVSGTALTFVTSSSNKFTLSLNALSIQNFDPSQNYTWTIGAFTSVAGFDASTLTLTENGFTGANGTFAVVNVNNTLEVTYTAAAVPEPSVWILLGLGSAAVAAASRRHRIGARLA